MDTPALVKISDIVNSYLNEMGEGVDNFFRYLQIVIEGLSTEINVTHSYAIKAYFTEVNSVNVVELPADCVSLSRVGILLDGLVYTLTRNRSISLPNGEICGVQIVADTNLNSQRIPTLLNYAKGGGYNMGSYRLNDRTLVFQGALSNEVIVLEYKSSGVNMAGETYLPTLLIPVLKEYLSYTLIRRNKNFSMAAKQQAKVDYVNAKRAYIKRKKPFNMFDVMDVIDSGKSQGVK